MSNGHRWSKFWWQDWQADKALRVCSLGARGLWMELLCMAHEGRPCGHVTINGKAASNRQMAAVAGCSEKDVCKYVAELEDAGVFSRTDDGTILCRRMVRDGAASEAGREHIAKRWGENTTPPPNRPPNRGATDEPIREATRKPNGEAISPPITQESEPESEAEPVREERKFKHLPSNSPELARAESDDEAPNRAISAAVVSITGRVGRALESSGKTPIGKPAKLTREQQCAVAVHGEDVLHGEELGRRGPVPPQRTVEEQLAILRAGAA